MSLVQIHMLPLVLLLVFALAQSVNAQQYILDSATERIDQANPENHEGKGGCVGSNTSIASPVRAGERAFRHEVRDCAERAELAMKRTKIGEIYWLGWSLYIPEDYEETSKGNIFAQWAAWPNKSTSQFPCKGVGHKLEMQDGRLEYHLQGSDNEDGNAGGFCETIRLAQIDNATKGRWIDFVQHVKWTGNPDGFVKLWLKAGEGDYEQVIDFTGRTWWNDEEDGPYFKMGLYTGDPGWTGRSPAVLYTDEYRLARADAGFRAVMPGEE